MPISGNTRIAPLTCSFYPASTRSYRSSRVQLRPPRSTAARVARRARRIARRYRAASTTVRNMSAACPAAVSRCGRKSAERPLRGRNPAESTGLRKRKAAESALVVQARNGFEPVSPRQLGARVEATRSSTPTPLHRSVLHEDAGVDELAQCRVRGLQRDGELARHDRAGEHEVTRQEVEHAPSRGIAPHAPRLRPRSTESFTPLALQSFDGRDQLLLRAAGARHRL